MRLRPKTSYFRSKISRINISDIMFTEMFIQSLYSKWQFNVIHLPMTNRNAKVSLKVILSLNNWKKGGKVIFFFLSPCNFYWLIFWSRITLAKLIFNTSLRIILVRNVEIVLVLGFKQTKNRALLSLLGAVLTLCRRNQYCVGSV